MDHTAGPEPTELACPTTAVINFEPSTARILDGILDVQYESAGGSIYHLPEAVDAAAIELATVDLDHFNSRQLMDEAIFNLARPAGAIKTFDRFLTGPSNNVFAYNIGYATISDARRAFTLMHGKPYTPRRPLNGMVENLTVRCRRFKFGKTWFALPVADFHVYQPTGLHVVQRAKALELAFPVQTDLDIALGPPLHLRPFSTHQPAPRPPVPPLAATYETPSAYQDRIARSFFLSSLSFLQSSGRRFAPYPSPTHRRYSRSDADHASEAIHTVRRKRQRSGDFPSTAWPTRRAYYDRDRPSNDPSDLQLLNYCVHQWRPPSPSDSPPPIPASPEHVPVTRLSRLSIHDVALSSSATRRHDSDPEMAVSSE